MDDVNPAIKGIEPSVTLAQANMIAEWADSIEGDDVDSPWAVAIANFKKAYKVEGGKWVKKATEYDVPGVGKVLLLCEGPPPAANELALGFMLLGSKLMLGHSVEEQEADGVCACPDCDYEATEGDTPCSSVECPECGAMLAAKTEPAEPEEGALAEASFAEAAIGHAISLAEGQLPLPHTELVPLHLDVALITPGWGNKRDNHYYPTDVVRRDAGVFAGSKMYESDHRPAEKSTRTWVSTVKEITGFTDDGAPIAQVSVHDKGFAERLVALAKDNLLDKMECSILAGGTARKGKVDGRKGNIVEAITSADSVDWVTKAGAGGRALALAESEEVSMPEQSTEGTTEQEVPEEEMAEEATQTTFAEQEEPEAPAPEPLAAEKVKELVEATNLPKAARAKLTEAQYGDEGEAQAAIQAEIAYIKELTGSGRPFAQGAGEAPQATPLSEEDKLRRFNERCREVGIEGV